MRQNRKSFGNRIADADRFAFKMNAPKFKTEKVPGTGVVKISTDDPRLKLYFKALSLIPYAERKNAKRVHEVGVSGGRLYLMPEMFGRNTEYSVQDIDKGALRSAKNADKRGRIKNYFHKDAVKGIPVGKGEMDAVIDFFAGMTFSKNKKERAAFLGNAREALRKDGKLVIGTYDKGAEKINRELENDRNAGFEVLNDIRSKNPGRKTNNRIIVLRKR